MPSRGTSTALRRLFMIMGMGFVFISFVSNVSIDERVRVLLAGVSW